MRIRPRTSIIWLVTGKAKKKMMPRNQLLTKREANFLCRVFEHLHQNEIKRAKAEEILTSNQLITIVHPNEYFKRSYLLKNLDSAADVKMEG
jgi:DNA primase large subunit